VARYSRALNILNARNAQQKFIVSQRAVVEVLRKEVARASDKVEQVLGAVDGGKGDEDHRVRAEKACISLQKLLQKIERCVAATTHPHDAFVSAFSQRPHSASGA
jgi:hypothetical protein